MLKAWDKNNFGNQKWVLIIGEVQKRWCSLIYTNALKKLLRIFNFTYIITSFNICKKLLRMYQMMRCVIIQMRKQIHSHSVTKETQEMVKPVHKLKCYDFRSNTLPL